MTSITTSAATGLAAVALAFAPVTAPFLEASSAGATSPASTGFSLGAPGHWQYKGTYSTYSACAQVRDSWEAFDITAQCRSAGNGWQLYIWLLH